MQIEDGTPPLHLVDSYAEAEAESSVQPNPNPPLSNCMLCAS